MSTQRIAPFTHESTQIQDNSKIFAAAESYKKNKYQEASAYENHYAVTYPFVMTVGGLGNDAKKFLRRMKAVALAKGRYRPVALIKSASRSGGKILHALWCERML